MGTYIPGSPLAQDENPVLETHFGCYYCLLESVETPVAVIYMWSGTSVCRNHLLAMVQKPPTQAVAAS